MGITPQPSNRLYFPYYPGWEMFIPEGHIIKRAWVKANKDAIAFWLDKDGKQVYFEVSGMDVFPNTGSVRNVEVANAGTD